METRQPQKSLISAAVSFAFNGIFEHMLSWLMVFFRMLGFGLLGVIVIGLLVGLGVFLTFSQELSAFYFITATSIAAIGTMFYGPSLHLGFIRTILQYSTTHEITFSPYFAMRAIAVFVISTFCIMILFGLGLALFIVPGIIVYLRTMFTTYFILDNHLGPIAAIQASWELTRGRYNLILGLALICALINIIPFVGWLMSSLMQVYVYEELRKEARLL